MQPPYKALPPSYYEQVAPAKALCLAVAFEAMSEQPGGFLRTMGADAPAEDEQGGCLSPPDPLYVLLSVQISHPRVRGHLGILNLLDVGTTSAETHAVARTFGTSAGKDSALAQWGADLGGCLSPP